MKFFKIIPICFLVLLLSCDKKIKDISETMGTEYFPLNPGKYYVYQVDSIIYDEFNQSVDTFKSRLKTNYLNEFIDSSYGTVLKVEHFNPDRGYNEPGNRWVSVINLDQNRVVNYSDTIRTIKMVFPVRNGKEWNANMFNTMQPRNYRFEKLGEPMNVLGTRFNETVTVKQFELVTLITEINSFEVYAKNVGMIYSENTFIQRFDGKVSGKKIITKLEEHN